METMNILVDNDYVYNNNPYDDGIKKMVSEAVGTVPGLINEMYKRYGIHLTGEESYELLATEHYITEQNGKQRKIISDVWIKSGRLMFHFEGESSANRMDVYRMYEYATITAVKYAQRKKSGIIIYPYQGVIYLRSNSNTPDVLAETIDLPFNRREEYKVPTLKVADYSAEDIVNKRLFFLMPFYIFNYEDAIKKGNKDILKRLDSELLSFNESLEEALEEGILSVIDIRTISDVFYSVLINITKNYETTGKEILEKLSGTLLNYPCENAFNEGEEKGREEGRKEGSVEGQKKFQKLLQKIPKESDDFNFALIASTDDLEELYKKYDIHSED